MHNWLNNHAFVAYAVTCLVLSVNLLFLWGYSGAVRAKTKIAINPEDSQRFGAPLQEFDPPEVARVLRAHDNASATIYPFLFLGWVFVLAGGSARVGAITFAVFSVARWLHTAMYLAGKQPWRTICFGLSALASLALIVEVVWLLIRGVSGA
jgi:microsomal prostaglandin-E synthase 1